jgi:hypothetical protein
MNWIRYLLYFVAIALLTWMLTQLEISSPGSLKLHVIAYEGDALGTSEYSPIEIIQPLILSLCGLMMVWVARYCPSQRPLAVPFSGLALMFMIRELDYFFDRHLIDNLWQMLIGIAGAFVITYTFRQQRRLKIALARLWPSPGLALMFAGAVILFVFVRLIGQESLWMSILGDDYKRIVKLAVEEFIELLGYLMWLIGSIEYAYQARSIAYREPQPAAQRLRDRRRHDQAGRY